MDLPDVLVQLDARVGAVRALGEVRPRHVHQQALGRVPLDVRAVQAFLSRGRHHRGLDFRGFRPYLLERRGSICRTLLLLLLQPWDWGLICHTLPLRCCGRISHPNVPEGLFPFGGIRVELGQVGPQAEVVGPHEGAVGTLPLLSAQLVEGIRIPWRFPLLIVRLYQFRVIVAAIALLGEKRPLWTDFEVVLEVLHGGGHVEAGRAHHIAAAAPLHLGVGFAALSRVLS